MNLGEEYLQDGATKQLLDFSQCDDEDLKLLGLQAPEKHRRSQRETLLKKIRAKDAIISRLTKEMESKLSELEMGPTRSLGYFESALSGPVQGISRIGTP